MWTNVPAPRTRGPTASRLRLVGYGVIVLVNLAALGAGLVAIDWWRKPSGAIATRREGTIVDGFLEPAIDVGYIGRADHRVTSRVVTASGKLVYDVAYTIGPDHFRVTPQADAPHTACVSVFGDSFAFGTGLNDDQTFAWRLVDESGGRTAAQIFAFPG